jgi:alanine racemase
MSHTTGNSSCAIIDTRAWQHNLTQVKRFAPGSQVMAVIKANAYGHGAIQAARSLSNADAFAVARMPEALELRDAGIKHPITILEGCLTRAELEVASAQNCRLVVHQEYQLAWLEQADLHQPIQVWLKVDSGMHRLGIAPEQVDSFYHRLQKAPSVAGPIGLITHFGCADEIDPTFTEAQIATFQLCCGGLPGERSLANSAGLIGFPQSQSDWVRPGIMLYGVLPMLQQTAQELELQPVMTLKSKVIAIRDHHRGEPVGYGATWRSDRDTQLAVVAIGYGDGYPRHAPSGTPVLIKDKRYPMVGRVSMDMITVDIGLDHDVKLGDSVILWGKGLPVEEIAQAAGTIGYELLCSVTRRVVFNYI